MAENRDEFKSGAFTFNLNRDENKVTVVRKFPTNPHLTLTNTVDIVVPEGMVVNGISGTPEGNMRVAFQDENDEKKIASNLFDTGIPSYLSVATLVHYKGQIEVSNGAGDNRVTYGSLTVRANGSNLEFVGKDQTHTDPKGKNIAAIVNLGGLVVIYDDNSHSVVSRQELNRIISVQYRAFRTKLQREFNLEAARFKNKIAEIPVDKNTPDGYNVRKVMQFVHDFLKKEYRTACNTHKQELIKTFQSLNLMIEDPKKALEAMTYSMASKPFGNIAAATGLFLGAAVVFGLSIAMMVAAPVMAGLFLVGLVGSAVMTYFGITHAVTAHNDRTYSNYTDQLRGFFADPSKDYAPKRGLFQDLFASPRYQTKPAAAKEDVAAKKDGVELDDMASGKAKGAPGKVVEEDVNEKDHSNEGDVVNLGGSPA